MSQIGELDLILKLINKYELPLSPILEYAIKERNDAAIEVDENATIPVVSEPVATYIDCPSDKLQERYRKYLFATKSLGTAKNCYGLIDRHVRTYINKVVDEEADTIYSFTTPKDIRNCLLKLRLTIRL